MEYENRFVAFIDILGFKNIVKASASSNKKISTTAFEKIKIINQRRDNVLNTSGYHVEDYRASHFSDCIVISVKNDDLSLHALIYDVMDLTVMLLQNGILARGGICYGKLYHNITNTLTRNDIVYGPALTKAYTLETESKYPRVVLDLDLSDEIVKENKSCKAFIKIDTKDQNYFVNYIDNCIYSYEKIEYEKLKSFCKEYFNPLEVKNSSIKEKYEWLLNQFKD